MVLVGKRVVLTAARAEDAVRFVVRDRIDLAGRQVYLIEAPGGGSACPMRYVVLTVTGTRSSATPPFGSCSSRARLLAPAGKVMVRMPGFSNIGPAGPDQLYTLEADRMVPAQSDSNGAASRAIVYAPSFACGKPVGPAGADAMLAAFETEYPKALVDPAQVELQDVTPATLEHLVADLACLAGQIGGDPFVPEQAAALFASRRYGVAAFAALDALARSGSGEAERFGVQMRAYTEAK